MRWIHRVAEKELPDWRVVRRHGYWFQNGISTTDFADSRANSCSIMETKAGIVTKRGDFSADDLEEALAHGDNPF